MDYPVKFPKKLIEVALPLEAINKAAAREKSIRHGHPSTLHLWWARRPLAAARAVIFAQMVDDPSAHPDLFPTEKKQDKERQRLFRIIEDLVLWENTNNETVLQQARDAIWQSWRYACAANADHPQAKELFDRHKLPAFHDPFAGGGALPLEAQRLGLEAYASDLNPVAVLINKAMIEIPPKFAGRAPVNPGARSEWRGVRSEIEAGNEGKEHALPGNDNVAEGNGNCAGSLSHDPKTSPGRTLRNALTDNTRGGFDSGKHRGGMDAGDGPGQSALSGHCTGLAGGNRDAVNVVRGPELVSPAGYAKTAASAGRGKPDTNHHAPKSASNLTPSSSHSSLLFPHSYQGAQGLAEDVRYYGAWMRGEAEKRIGHLYPKIEITAEMVRERPDLKPLLGQKLTVIAWLWARTVKSPNPAFAHVDVPLASTFMLSTKAGKEAYVEVEKREGRSEVRDGRSEVRDGRSEMGNEAASLASTSLTSHSSSLTPSSPYRFTVKVGKPKDADAAKNGTKAGGSHSPFLCLISGVPMPFEYLRSESRAGRMGARLMAIVAEGTRGRVYLSPTSEMESIALSARPEWKPDVEICHWPGRTNVVEYGLTRFGDLFTPRQLVALTTFSDLVQEARAKVLADAQAAWGGCNASGGASSAGNDACNGQGQSSSGPNQACTKANQASSSSDEASSVANQASSTSDEASSKANQASSLSDEASSSSDEASSKANQASSSSDEASSVANQASSLSDEASSKSDEASSVANQASYSPMQVCKTAPQASKPAHQASKSANTTTKTPDNASQPPSSLTSHSSPLSSLPLDDGGTGPQAYADAVAVYLAFAVDRFADYWTSLGRWQSANQQFSNLFGRQAIPMMWDFPEANPFSGKGGSFDNLFDWTVQSIPRIGFWDAGISVQGDAGTQSHSISKVVSTDPPYYDNIGYADLSDFFYVWLRRSLKPVFPNLFATLAVPKAEELVATPYRHGGKKEAEAFFLVGMTRAIWNIAEQAHQSFPVTIYYAFKQSETSETDGTFSTGWETFLDAVISAGFGICGTWPMRTELGNRMIGSGTNALASSIVLVCRKRASDAAVVSRRDFVAALKSELPSALRHLQSGNIAPVDLAQAAIGPGMGVFSRYAKVVDAEGKTVAVRDALMLINQVLDETLQEQEGDFDGDSRWALAWFEQSGFDAGDYGVAETLSKAKNTSVAGLVEAGLLHAKGGKVRLLKPAELPADWDPATDLRLTAWEMVHHLVRLLESGGEGAAAALAAKLGTKAETARELCYRLYTVCERKKRAAEALSYNGLVQSWPEIMRLARASTVEAPHETAEFNWKE